jgi:NADH-quinone oxidoreductase subunit L
MKDTILFLPILLPFGAGVLLLLAGKKFRILQEALLLIVTLCNAILCVALFKNNFMLRLPWAGFGMDFSLRIYHFGAFILLAAAGFGVLVSLY